MNRCYLGLGSNLNSPERQLRLALSSLRKLPKSYLSQIAPFYFNKAWGRKGMPDYCNTVIELKTKLSPFLLLKYCQQIEIKQGRQRKVRFAARTLDIDILSYDNRKITNPKLSLPHPRMHKRDFVLIPLSQMQAMMKL